MWSYNLSSPLADGNHSLRATTTDAAGNLSAQSTAVNVTVDTQPPTVQSFTRLDPANTSASSVRYELVLGKPITGLSASDLSLITSGSAKGSIGSIVRISDSHYVVQLLGLSGSGSVALALKAGAAADLAGNVTQQQTVAPAYQLSAQVVVVMPPVADPVPAAPSSAPVINVGPITPNIVLAAVSNIGRSGGVGDLMPTMLSGPQTAIPSRSSLARTASRRRRPRRLAAAMPACPSCPA